MGWSFLFLYDALLVLKQMYFIFILKWNNRKTNHWAKLTSEDTLDEGDTRYQEPLLQRQLVFDGDNLRGLPGDVGLVNVGTYFTVLLHFSLYWVNEKCQHFGDNSILFFWNCRNLSDIEYCKTMMAWNVHYFILDSFKAYLLAAKCFATSTAYFTY